MSKNEKLNLIILFGGRSGEHDVSLDSARSVLSALDPKKYCIHRVGISRSGQWLYGDSILEKMMDNDLESLEPVTLLPSPTQPYLYKLVNENNGTKLEKITEFDVVLPILHGTYGEDGTLQGMLELTDVAYVGAGVLGSAVGMDKGVFKDVMKANHIPVVDSIIVSQKQIAEDINSVVDQASQISSYPLFVKPANLGSSVGITKCNSRSDLFEGLLEAAQYDRRILIEKGINAREIEISVLGNENPMASIPGEIIPSRDFYSYEAKYIDDESELLIPAPISDKLKSKLQDCALRTYKAIDCAGMARVDFLLDKENYDANGEPAFYLNEVNTIPGFTTISMYPKLWEASGLGYSELLDRLIALAVQRKQERNQIKRTYMKDGGS